MYIINIFIFILFNFFLISFCICIPKILNFVNILALLLLIINYVALRKHFLQVVWILANWGEKKKPQNNEELEIDYWAKGIEFALYDSPIENPNLIDYMIGSIRIVHQERTISVIFEKREAIAAVGIYVNKWRQASNKEELSRQVIYNGKTIDIEDCDVLDFLKTINSSNIELRITSVKYDLRKEKGVVCHYNTNDMYEDELLNSMLNSFKKDI